MYIVGTLFGICVKYIIYATVNNENKGIVFLVPVTISFNGGKSYESDICCLTHRLFYEVCCDAL